MPSPDYRTCPRCGTGRCPPQFCPSCNDHFGPDTPWPCQPDGSPPLTFDESHSDGPPIAGGPEDAVPRETYRPRYPGTSGPK